jgi:hypothetical protein
MPPPPSASSPSEDRDEERRRRRRRDREDREDREDRQPPPKSGCSLGTLLILGVFFFFGCPVLIALLVPAVQKVREAAARTQSINNLKVIGLGFHGFHDANKHFPCNGGDDGNRQKKAAAPNFPDSGSWGYQILPYIDNQPLYQSVNPNVGVPTYMCPGRGRPMVEAGKGAWSDYFYNNYLGDVHNASKPDRPNNWSKLAGIPDGLANTIMIGHGNIATTQYQQAAGVTACSTVLVGGTIGTMRSGDDVKGNEAPTGVTLMRDSATQPSVGSWGGPFPAGALMGMADGTVRIFSYQTANFGAFLTPNGAEPFVLPDER